MRLSQLLASAQLIVTSYRELPATGEACFLCGSNISDRIFRRRIEHPLPSTVRSQISPDFPEGDFKEDFEEDPGDLWGGGSGRDASIFLLHRFSRTKSSSAIRRPNPSISRKMREPAHAGPCRVFGLEYAVPDTLIRSDRSGLIFSKDHSTECL